MEPRREEPRREELKSSEPQPREKPSRFRLIKLEERIAPGGSNPHSHKCDNWTLACYAP
jgi:hypothetical protein